jgi:CheY-like chemotaxis protein
MADLSLPGPIQMRVLLVEDDYFQQVSITAIVRLVESNNPGTQLDLTCAQSGAEAVAACRASAESFDLVLLDYKLPGGDGDAVLPAIREEVGSVCAVVMLSGDAQEASMQRCWLDLGADSYRIKVLVAPSNQCRCIRCS